ncbi:hypothetical protein KUL72_29555 [Bradyrhizobium arachidis]|nr:hypothetical protein [Bradyrhizobium arachidis]UVO35549.1 hypothetical protein KUL72_29555 [Bradyrhizobium arachidis]
MTDANTESDHFTWEYQISSIGMRQIPLPFSSTTETEQLRPANSGRVARKERANLIASV